MDIQEAILKSIEKTIDIREKDLDYVRIIRGKVVSINVAKDECVVEIFGEDSRCKVLDGISISVGDIVLIITFQNNFQEKIILGKIGNAI